MKPLTIKELNLIKTASSEFAGKLLAKTIEADGSDHFSPEYEKAAKELKSCVYMRPENASYNYYLGLAESEVPGLYKSAEQHLLKAMELEKMSSDSRIALVKLYLKARLPMKAEALLKELMRWDPDHPEAKKLQSQIEKI